MVRTTLLKKCSQLQWKFSTATLHSHEEISSQGTFSEIFCNSHNIIFVSSLILSWSVVKLAQLSCQVERSGLAKICVQRNFRQVPELIGFPARPSARTDIESSVQRTVWNCSAEFFHAQTCAGNFWNVPVRQIKNNWEEEVKDESK